jgi:hypothetical protein
MADIRLGMQIKPNPSYHLPLEKVDAGRWDSWDIIISVGRSLCKKPYVLSSRVGPAARMALSDVYLSIPYPI